MSQTPHLNQLRLELQTFSRLGATSNLRSITDSYNRILSIVQAMMLGSDNPDTHVRAWNLLNEAAYKDLADVQAGRATALQDLNFKINQVGELLLNP